MVERARGRGDAPLPQPFRERALTPRHEAALDVGFGRVRGEGQTSARAYSAAMR